MFFYKYFIFSIISLIFTTARSQSLADILDGEYWPMKALKKERWGVSAYESFKEGMVDEEEKVKINLYYESHCPGCRIFDTTQLAPTVEKLASNLDIHTYPYGNAKTIDKGNGQYDFVCRHGPAECYGNKLHACVIDFLGNITKSVLFNSCIMISWRTNGSDDEAVDRCGKAMNIESEPIKECAKGSKGSELLKYYGDESHKVSYKRVPFVLLNGEVYHGDDFFKDVCAAFRAPPPACAQEFKIY